MVMFDDLEKEARLELKKLYQDFIDNPEDETLEDRAFNCDQTYGGVPVLSKEVSYAGSMATHIATKDLLVDDAKKILKTLL